MKKSIQQAHERQLSFSLKSQDVAASLRRTRKKTIVAAIGITDKAEKIPLGIREGNTENAIDLRINNQIMQQFFESMSENRLALVPTKTVFLNGAEPAPAIYRKRYIEFCFHAFRL
jgi:hypothetical protein